MIDRKRPAIVVALIVLAVAWIAGQWTAIRTENINWDEFAFLARAHSSAQTGNLAGGGRPGLAVLFLMPFARGCADSVSAIVAARMLWLGWTIGILAGTFALVVQTRREGDAAWPGAAVAVALSAAVPVFMRWSLHVRTDQPAAFFALWGGACLLASRRRFWLALPSGVLFALGLLCTQKAAYLGALAVLLFLRRIHWRRDVPAAAVTAAALLFTIGAFYAIVSFFFRAPGVTTLESGLNTFAYYRQSFGYGVYRAMVPSLAAHGLLVILVVIALVVARSHAPDRRADLMMAAAVLLLGVAVGAFHAAAFPYFWITLGVFPAVAIGVAWPALLEVYQSGRERVPLVAALTLLAVVGVRGWLAIHRDTQAVQRDALGFIARHFPPEARGFQAEGALTCRPDPDPFPSYFADAARRFDGDTGRPLAERFIQEFRGRPVAFMIAHRLFPFATPIQVFWDSHYVVYRNEVMVPGRRVRGRSGQTFTFDALMPATYRWFSEQPSSARLERDGAVIRSGDRFQLSPGEHRFRLLDDATAGVLAQDMGEDAQPSGPEFYAADVLREIDPAYPRFKSARPYYLFTEFASGGASR